MTENITQIEDRLIPATEVRYRLGLSKTTFHRLRQRGVIPEPVRLGACVRWPNREIERLISNLAASRHLSTSSSSQCGLEPNRRRQRKPNFQTQLNRTMGAS